MNNEIVDGMELEIIQAAGTADGTIEGGGTYEAGAAAASCVAYMEITTLHPGVLFIE